MRRFDPLLKELIAAAEGLKAADAEARRAFWANLDEWQTTLDAIALSLRGGARVTAGGGLASMDPRRDQRPDAARRVLMTLHFGVPDLQGPQTDSQRVRADVDHITQRIAASHILSPDASIKQRLDLVKAKLMLARGSVPPEVHVAVLSLLIRCYRALWEARKQS